MGIFGKKKLTLEEASDKCIAILKEVDIDENSEGVVFLAGSKGNGTSYILGAANEISSIIEASCNQNQDFRGVLYTTVKKIQLQFGNNIPGIPKNIQNILNKIDGEKKSEVIDLPNGDKGIAIDLNNIDDMTNKDIDNIIDKILKENGISDDESESSKK